MKQLTGALALAVTITLQACLSSSLVLQVAPDGHGRAIITSRLYEEPYRAFETIFNFDRTEQGVPAAQPKAIEDILREQTEQYLSGVFGAPVTIESTALEKTADGVVRKTTVAFPDITQLRVMFPPIVDVPGDGGLATSGPEAVITFAIRPHENGDRLLIVRMPDAPAGSEPNPAATPQPENKRLEEQLKRAAKGMRVEFAVELETPLLRTNAPQHEGNHATILDVDVGKLVNEFDEAKMARVTAAPASIQELLWAVSDVGAGATPIDREIFLEFESPAAPAQPAAQPPRPDTEIFLAPLTTRDGRIELGAPVNITSNPGYDNQPFFTPDGRSVLFTSVRGRGTQTDIYRYDIGASTLSQVTDTPESEYSPTITPSGDLSVVRVELDSAATQRLWRFTADGRDPRLVLETVKPVGYHAWSDDHTVALFVLGRPATLQVADTRAGTSRVVASDIARSLQAIPGGRTLSFVQREGAGANSVLTIKELDPANGEAKTLTRAVPGGDEADVAWTPDGTLLMARGDVLYAWRRGDAQWRPVAALDRLGLTRVSRIAVSPAGDRIAFVAQLSGADR